jgi:uncharacterized damage-inducible protein DinB
MSENQIEQLAVTAEPATDPEIGRGLWRLNAARGRLLETLQGVDAAALDWVPPYRGNSIGTLLYHIAAIEVDWLYCEVVVSDFPPEVVAMLPFDVRDGDGRLTAVPDITLHDHLARLEQTRGLLTAVYANMSIANYRRTRHLPDYDVTPEWVLFHLTQHETEHRGHIQEIMQQFNLHATKR